MDVTGFDSYFDNIDVGGLYPVFCILSYDRMIISSALLPPSDLVTLEHIAYYRN